MEALAIECDDASEPRLSEAVAEAGRIITASAGGTKLSAVLQALGDTGGAFFGSVHRTFFGSSTSSSSPSRKRSTSDAEERHNSAQEARRHASAPTQRKDGGG